MLHTLASASAAARRDVGQQPLVWGLAGVCAANILVLEVVLWWAAAERCLGGGGAGDGAAETILVVADPQLTDSHSYSMSQGPLLWFTEFYSDLYMLRAYRWLQVYVATVVVLGDMFDGGGVSSPREWRRSLSRYQWVFADRGDPVTKVSVAGNHDLGYAANENPAAYQRWESAFGPLNSHKDVWGHTRLVLLNSVVLDAERTSPGHAAAVREVEAAAEWAAAGSGRRTVLVSHIPLYPGNASVVLCGGAGTVGRARTKRVIGSDYETAVNGELGSPRVQIRYQNYLLPASTEYLLRMLEPVVVLSGHDHDWCFHNRTLASGFHSLEYTVGTFSWLQGNLWPSVAVLRVPRSGSEAVSVWRCGLPSQLLVLLQYVVMLLGVLVACAVRVEPGRAHDQEAGVRGRRREWVVAPLPDVVRQYKAVLVRGVSFYLLVLFCVCVV